MTLTFRCAACGWLSGFMFRVTPIAKGLRDLKARGEFRCAQCRGTSLEGPVVDDGPCPYDDENWPPANRIR